MFNPNYIDEFRQFIPKLFLQNNLWKYNFSQMKNFFDLRRRSDIFGMWKKSMIFVPKIITQNIFKIQKKFSDHEKVENLSFQTIKDSTQTQGMTKI